METTETKKKKTISETKCTCNACGHIWHFGKKEKTENAMNALHNFGKAMSCCGGCAPAVLIKDKEVTDLKQCPQCKSHNVKFEEVSYEVDR
jgi:hypothetical protein